MSNRALVISSDGHATARMEEYAPYLPERSRAEFKEFCKVYKESGSKNFEPRALSVRLDPEVIEDWKTRFLDSGRLDGNSDPAKRLVEMDNQGVAAEVIFPDFGVPFELLSPTASGAIGRTSDWRTPEQIEDGNIAYNRWLADFVSEAPERFAGMAKVSFDDVDAALAETRWAKGAGLRGILVGHMEDDRPVYHPDFDPIWSLCEELDMVVNCHAGMSSVTRRRPAMPKVAHPACAVPLLGRELLFVTQQLLLHFMWGGVLERHPRMKLVFTEIGTAWAGPAVAHMDHNYEGSWVRRDTHDVLKMKPSEYFARQCWIGSSTFSKAEVEARGAIGPDKMMLGYDFPHHEGVLPIGSGTASYLRATLGAAQVPKTEALQMLGESALDVFGFDAKTMRAVADRIGPDIDLMLTPPEVDEYPRGDVWKPLIFV